jgi:hypothetical protein
MRCVVGVFQRILLAERDVALRKIQPHLVELR